MLTPAKPCLNCCLISARYLHVRLQRRRAELYKSIWRVYYSNYWAERRVTSELTSFQHNRQSLLDNEWWCGSELFKVRQSDDGHATTFEERGLIYRRCSTVRHSLIDRIRGKCLRSIGRVATVFPTSVTVCDHENFMYKISIKNHSQVEATAARSGLQRLDQIACILSELQGVIGQVHQTDTGSSLIIQGW